MQDHTEALKQRAVKLEQMAARNSNDKVISSQVHACIISCPDVCITSVYISLCVASTMSFTVTLCTY